MKTFFKLILAVSCFIFIAFSCTKAKNNDPASNNSASDNTAPVITLKGDADMSVSLGSNTADPGANAVDNIDGDISSSVSSDWNSSVDQNKSGSYTVNYSVSDKAGNKAGATRKVTVKSTAGNLTGVYKTTITTSYGTSGIFNSTVSVGNGPSQIIINPFYAVLAVPANLTGLLNDQLSIDYESQGMHFTGTGTISNGGKNMTINGTVVTSSGSQAFSENLWKE